MDGWSLRLHQQVRSAILPKNCYITVGKKTPRTVRKQRKKRKLQSARLDEGTSKQVSVCRYGSQTAAGWKRHYFLFFNNLFLNITSLGWHNFQRYSLSCKLFLPSWALGWSCQPGCSSRQRVSTVTSTFWLHVPPRLQIKSTLTTLIWAEWVFTSQRTTEGRTEWGAGVGGGGGGK